MRVARVPGSRRAVCSARRSPPRRSKASRSWRTKRLALARTGRWRRLRPGGGRGGSRCPARDASDDEQILAVASSVWHRNEGLQFCSQLDPLVKRLWKLDRETSRGGPATCGPQEVTARLVERQEEGRVPAPWSDGETLLFKVIRSHSLPGRPRRSRRQGCQGAMNLVSHVVILVVHQRFEGLGGDLGAAGRHSGELGRGHDPDSRILVLERLFDRLESRVGIGIEPEDCGEPQGRVLALPGRRRIELLCFDDSFQ